jgi:hypothetical protein
VGWEIVVNVKYEGTYGLILQIAGLNLTED